MLARLCKAVALCLAIGGTACASAGAVTVGEYTSQGERARVSITASRVTFDRLPLVFRCVSGYQVVLYDNGTYLTRTGYQLSLIGQNGSDKYRFVGHVANGLFIGQVNESYTPAGYRGPCTASASLGNGFYYEPKFKTKFVIGRGVTSAPLEALIMYGGGRFEETDTYWAQCYECSGSNGGPVRSAGGSMIRFVFPHRPIINDHSSLLIGRSGPGTVGRFRIYRLSVYDRRLRPVRTFCTPPAITPNQLYNDVFPSRQRIAVTVGCP